MTENNSEGPSRLPHTEELVDALKMARSFAVEVSRDICAWVGPLDSPLPNGDPNSPLERMWRLRHYAGLLDKLVDQYIDPALAAAGGPSRLRALELISRRVVEEIDAIVNTAPFADIDSFAVERIVLRGLEEALVGPVSVETKQQEETNDDHARVDSFPGGEHGDLPRRATE